MAWLLFLVYTLRWEKTRENTCRDAHQASDRSRARLNSPLSLPLQPHLSDTPSTNNTRALPYLIPAHRVTKTFPHPRNPRRLQLPCHLRYRRCRKKPLRIRRSWKRFWSRSSSASRRTSRRASCAPPSPASSGSPSSLALASAVATREHHGASPTFGFLKSSRWRATEPEEGYPAVPPFFSTTGFRARVPDDGWGHRNYAVVDCRHGRALLDERTVDSNLAVWDPMTGRRRELQKPAVLAYGSGKYAAAVLCAVSGCDHLACHEGPFRVVFFSRHKVGDDDLAVQVRVSSPETWDCSKRSSDFHRAEWSQPCPGVSIQTNGFIYPRPPVLVNDALHLMLVREGPAPDGVCYTQILTYDLRSNCLSLIDAPKHKIYASILVAMEDGSLGFAHLKELTLFIWSRHMGSDNFAVWTQRGVIDLKNLLSIENPRTYIRLLGSVEGSDIIFVSTDLGIYKINLKSLRQKKISNEEDVVSLIPYVSFYNPREKGETL